MKSGKHTSGIGKYMKRLNGQKSCRHDNYDLIENCSIPSQHYTESWNAVCECGKKIVVILSK